MTRSRYRIFEDEYPYFITDTIVAWLPIFSRPEFVQIIFDSWRYLQTNCGVNIFGYVILENHLHWIASGESLSKSIGRFKSYTARTIIDEMETRRHVTLLQELPYFKLRHKIDQVHQLWQEGSHPKQMQNVAMMLQKLEYMHYNPIRRGYVEDPTHWRYSGARNYAGLRAVLDITADWQ
jgi:REP element-mobilizing transposase RayT